MLISAPEGTDCIYVRQSKHLWFFKKEKDVVWIFLLSFLLPSAFFSLKSFFAESSRLSIRQCCKRKPHLFICLSAFFFLRKIKNKKLCSVIVQKKNLSHISWKELFVFVFVFFFFTLVINLFAVLISITFSSFCEQFFFLLFFFFLFIKFNYTAKIPHW